MRALDDLKRYEEAKKALEQAQRLAPGDTQVLHRLGLAEARLNHPARAAELMSKVLAGEPGNGTAHLELGQALLELWRGAEGLLHLRKAVKLDPANAQAAYALLRALNAEGSGEASQLGQRVRELKREELLATQAGGCRTLTDVVGLCAGCRQGVGLAEGDRRDAARGGDLRGVCNSGAAAPEPGADPGAVRRCGRGEVRIAEGEAVGSHG